MRFPSTGPPLDPTEIQATASAESVRFPRLAHVVGRLIAGYVEILVRTCRFEGRLTADAGVVAIWHEANVTGLVAALMRRRHLPHASFSTRGFRGIVITTLVEHFGGRVIPLPSEDDRAAARSLSLLMARLATAGYSIGVTADGPFGPPYVAKPGALLIARAAGAPLLTLSPGARPALRLPRWDRHIVPLPFARVWVVEGSRFEVEPRTPITRSLVAQLTEELRRLAHDTERRMRGEPQRLP
ncbi:MAG: lysophospholipid acyltransferase family protein [Candidatus Limnocylindria bacterium]